MLPKRTHCQAAWPLPDPRPIDLHSPPYRRYCVWGMERPERALSMTSEPTGSTDTTPERAYQFGLKILFILPLFVVAYFALAHWVGGFFAVLLMIPAFLVAGCFHPRTRVRAIQYLATYFVVIGLLAALLFPAVHGPQGARRSTCSNNLKQIGLALHIYHDTYGSLPPAYVTDDNGRPVHSWRVLLLPFLEQQLLYGQYRFDEPWDGPNNIKLVEKMPSIFKCPSNKPEEETYTTNYVVVIGARTAWPGETTTQFSDITDGTSNTWLVVEVADSGIPWTEPRDLHVLQMAREINPLAGQGISSKHPGGAQVLLADGSVRFIDSAGSKSSPDPEDVHRFLTIDDGEPVTQHP